MPSGFTSLSATEDAAVLAAMTQALRDAGFPTKAYAAAAPASHMPAVGEESTWGIKCGTMYTGCPSGQCGQILRLRFTSKNGCAMGNGARTAFIKVGKLDVPSSGSFTMPSHGKVVVGFGTRANADQLSVGCEGATKTQFLSDVDEALRAGIAKARFVIGKNVEAKLFALKD